MSESYLWAIMDRIPVEGILVAWGLHPEDVLAILRDTNVAEVFVIQPSEDALKETYRACGEFSDRLVVIHPGWLPTDYAYDECVPIDRADIFVIGHYLADFVTPTCVAIAKMGATVFVGTDPFALFFMELHPQVRGLGHFLPMPEDKATGAMHAWTKIT